MSPQQQLEINKRARAFIDQIAAINRQFGMGVAEDAYEDAVKGSAGIVTELARRSA
jgi:hypothetical protein